MRVRYRLLGIIWLEHSRPRLWITPLATGFLCVVATAAQRAQDFQSGRPSPTRQLTTHESEALRKEARASIDAGKLDAAWTLVERSRGFTNATERTAWWLLEAELEHGRKHYAKSALAAMRIVILHPKSEYVGAALYWTARGYEALSRPAKAVSLYEQCLAQKRMPPGLRDAATKRAKALKKLAKP